MAEVRTPSNLVRPRNYSPKQPDEVAALVVDIGSSTLRAGYAGDDTPRATIPTYYGYKSQPPDSDVTMDGTADDHSAPRPTPKIAKMFVGQGGPSIYRDGMEVGNPMKEGLSTRLLSVFTRPLLIAAQLRILTQ